MKSFIIILIVLLVFGGLFFYFIYEKPQQNYEDSYASITLFSEYLGSNIETGYELYVNNNLYRSGKTLKENYLKETIPINSTVFLRSKNLENQSFYSTTTEEKIVYDNSTILGFKLPLVKPSKLEVKNFEKFEDEYKIILSSKGEYRNIFFCLKWSGNVVSVKSNDNILLEKPFGYGDYVRCYDTQNSLNNNQKDIYLQYQVWGNPTPEDKIEIVFNDRDYVEGVLTNYNNKDLGGDEVKYVL